MTSANKDMFIQKLNKVPNIDIYIEIKKIQTLSSTMEKLVLSMKEAVSLIYKLKSYKNQYKVHLDNLEHQIQLCKNNSIFETSQLNFFQKEGNLYTKNNLIQKYIQIDEKYTDLTEYYKRIDRYHYRELLSECIEEMF